MSLHAVALALACATGLAPAGGARAQIAFVSPTVETDPTPNGGDSADDAAIWIHPSDPAQSVVIGTDK
ncbi:MAG: phytase, partial [Actinobacteria bacterium]|nr:phytase [Actinomycetota bacterium]